MELVVVATVFVANTTKLEFKPENTLGFLIKQAARGLRNKVNESIREQGLNITMEQGGVLMRLWMGDGITQSELVSFLDKDKTTVTRLVDTMENDGLVVRVSSNLDKRMKLIYMTKPGEKAQEKVKLAVIKTLGLAQLGLSDDELSAFLKTLKKIINNLHADDDISGCLN